MRQATLVLACCLCVPALPLTAQERVQNPPSVAEVRRVLTDRENKNAPELVRLGESVLPAFEAILNDPEVTVFELCSIFVRLRELPCDRSRFVSHAVKHLAYPNLTVRIRALALLEQIGSPADASPVVALLWGLDSATPYSALKTLGAIGGERELVALDIWDKEGPNVLTGTDFYRRQLEESRQAIRKRVEEEKKKKGG